MINQQVIDQHAEEAAFLWRQRDHATSAPQYALKDLAKLDERVEAHLDALRIAKSAGWSTVHGQLDQGRGEVFAAAVLAFEGGDPSRVKRVLDVGCPTTVFGRALISALGWIPSEVSLPTLTSLLESPDASVRRVAIGGMAVHRIDPGNALAVSIRDSNAGLATRAIKAAAELGRFDLMKTLAERMNDG